MSDHDDMMNDYDWHQNTGELPEYFDDNESEFIDNNQPNYSQADGGSMAGCMLIAIGIIVVGILIWLIL